MKSTSTFLQVAAAIAIATLIVCVSANSVLMAQNPNREMSGQGQHAWRASELIGLSVHNTGDEEKGKIKDLMITPDGRVEYAAVSFGGFLGMGDKLFAVPLDAIHFTWKDNKIEKAHVDVTEQSIKQRQGFDDSHWPEHADRGFADSMRKP